MGDELSGSAIIVRGIVGAIAEAKHPPGIPHIDAIVYDASAIMSNVYVPIFVNQRIMSRIVKLQSRKIINLRANLRQ